MIMLISLFFATMNVKPFFTLENINKLALSITIPGYGESKSKFYDNEEQENQTSKVEVNSDEKEYSSKKLNNEKSKYESESRCEKITESQFGKSGIKCDNFYIKNITGKDINFDYYLSQKPSIKIKNKKKPIVLIYHTHTTERYIDSDVKIKDYYPRSHDNSKNVIAVGEEIVKTLKQNGINAIHDSTVHDYPEFTGSYSRSAKTVRDLIKQYPEIQIEIDIHRDSINEEKRGRIKPTFKTKDGEKASQIMFVSGCGINKKLGFPNWEKNLILALNIQRICENYFPGFTREMYVKNVRYNQNINTGSLLIEVGSEVNTIEESKRSGRMLGKAISIFLNQYMKKEVHKK